MASSSGSRSTWPIWTEPAATYPPGPCSMHQRRLGGERPPGDNLVCGLLEPMPDCRDG
jgi:hypothetical protein